MDTSLIFIPLAFHLNHPSPHTHTHVCLKNSSIHIMENYMSNNSKRQGVAIKGRQGLSWSLSGKESTLQCRWHWFSPWSGKIPHALERLSPEPMCAPQLLSLCSGVGEPQMLSLRATATEAHTPRACALQQEKPLQWEAHSRLQWEAHSRQQRVAPAVCS